MANLSNILPPGNLTTASNTQTLTNKTIQAGNMTGATQFAGSSGTAGQAILLRTTAATVATIAASAEL